MNIAQKSTFVLGSRHLLGIEGLSHADIVGLLDLAEAFVDLNRQMEKKTASLRGRALTVRTRRQARHRRNKDAGVVVGLVVTVAPLS